MRDIQGRSWRNFEINTSEEIKTFLIEKGGVEKEVKSIHEEWRIKFSDSTFTYYKKGTLYSTPSNSKDPAVFNAWEYIDSLIGSAYVLPTKDFLIGLDETGKGEVIGHTVLTGAEDYLKRGNMYFEQGQFEQAIKEYKKALQVDQDNFMAWLRMGDSYRELSKYDDAINCYKRAVQGNPELAEAWFGMVEVYGKLEEYNRAIDCYQEAVEINPELAEAWFGMGLAYQREGAQDGERKAADCYEKAVEIKPDFAEAWERVAWIYQGEFEEWENAVRCFEKLIPLLSDDEIDPNIWGGLRFSYVQLDDSENVIRCSKKLLEHDEGRELLAGNDIEEVFWSDMGEHYAKLGDFNKAIDCYQEALDFNPENYQTLYKKGIAYGRLVERTKEKPSDEVIRKIDDINGLVSYFFPKMKKLLGISEAITDINKPVEGRKDLLYNISGLSNLIKKMNVSGLQRELNMKNEDRSINLLEAFLVEKFKKYDSRIIENLRLIQRLRSKIVHQEKSGFLTILKQLKLQYPKDKDDWRSIWKTSLNLYLQSLELLEKLLSKLFSKKD